MIDHWVKIHDGDYDNFTMRQAKYSVLAKFINIIMNLSFCSDIVGVHTDSVKQLVL
jgi:hypothetical protein